MGGMQGGNASATLVGRATELQLLAERAAVGTGLVLITGDAGIGKTRLLNAFLDEQRDAGALTMLGSCIELVEDAVPFAPITQALRRVAKDPSVGDEASDLLTTLLRVPDDGAGHGSSASGSRGAFFTSVLELLTLLAAERSVILAIEDFHWSDSSSRDLVSFLVGNLADERVLLVITYRSDELHRKHPLRPWAAEANRRQSTTCMEVPPLEESEIAQLATSVTGETARHQLVAELAARSEGNPLFVEELLAARDSGAGRIPTNVRDLVVTRVERLSNETQEVLRVVSASTRPVDHRIISTVSGFSDDVISRAFREAHEQQVLTFDPDQRHVFRHSLIREAIYDELLPDERERLHASFAGALEGADPEAPDPLSAIDVAYHWYASGDAAHALPAAVKAAEVAERAHGVAEAQSAYERALELWNKAPREVTERFDRIDILCRAGDCASLAEQGRRALSWFDTALSEVDEATDPLWAGRIRARRGHCLLWHMGDNSAAFEEFDRAAELLIAVDPSPEQARSLADIAIENAINGHVQKAARYSLHALDSARLAQSKEQEGAILNALGTVTGIAGDVIPAVTFLSEALKFLTETGGHEVGVCYSNLSVAGWLDLEDGVRIAREGAEYVRRTDGENHSYRFLLCNAAEFLVLLGRWDEVEEIVADVLRFDTSASVEAFACILAVEVAVSRGRFEEAHELLTRAREPTAGLDLISYWAPQAAAEAELLLWERDPETASSLASRAATVAYSGQVEYSIPLMALGVRAETELADRARAAKDAAAEWDAVQRASVLVDSAQTAAGLNTGRFVTAYAALCEAEFSRVVARPRPEAFAAAAARFEEIGVPYWTAYARYREAEALIASPGGRERAADVLRSSHAIADDLSAAPLRTEIEMLARRARIDVAAGSAGPTEPMAESTTDGYGLTSREVEVLRLVAEGKTNPEIAAELFISKKTASVHVSHILAKLGVASRVEAAGIAHRAGLLDESVSP